MAMIEPLTLLIGAVTGGVIVWVAMYYRGRARYEAGLREGDAERARLQERLEQKEKQLEETDTRLMETFRNLSTDALQKNNKYFLELAKQTLDKYQQGARDDLTARQKSIEELTKPIRERLERFDTKLGELEKSRVGAYSALNQQLKSLIETHLPQLHSETANLVKALRQPTTRGRWGEMQLRRVVEMAGMQEHCDFEEQESVTTEDGRRRPDLIVKLPGGRQIVVDAKTPVDAYLSAVETDSEENRNTLLGEHARQVRTHIDALGRKSYFEQFDPTPEFAVMFVPGEAFFSAALAQDPELIERGAKQRVIPASPTTLIALLKAVAYGWRQEAIAQNAAEVADLGRELYERIQTLAGHWKNVGKRIDQTVDAYNKSVGTLERRVLVSARRFQDLQAAPGYKDIEPMIPVDHSTSALNAPEMEEAVQPHVDEDDEEDSDKVRTCGS